MPIYEYRCSACGHHFDLRQSFSDEAVANCPQCQAPGRRILQPVGIVFKGSGWHVTDYRNKRSGDGNGKSEGSGESSSETKDAKEPKTETKSETSKAGASSTPDS